MLHIRSHLDVADNTGARATGSQRLTVNLNINSPGGRGELISLTGLHTQGSDYGRVAVTVPVGYDGLRLGGNLSSMLYKVVEGPGVGTSAQVKGRSGSMGLDLIYPRPDVVHVKSAPDSVTVVKR